MADFQEQQQQQQQQQASITEEPEPEPEHSEPEQPTPLIPSEPPISLRDSEHEDEQLTDESHWQPLHSHTEPQTPPPVLEIRDSDPRDVSGAGLTMTPETLRVRGRGSIEGEFPGLGDMGFKPEDRGDFLLIGICGPPLCEKSAVSRVLVEILEGVKNVSVFCLTQDEYRVEPWMLVPDADGTWNVYCPEGYHFGAFKRMLEYVKEVGGLPLGYGSPKQKEGGNGMRKAAEGDCSEWTSEMAALIEKSGVLDTVKSIGIVDGDLLYVDEEIRDILDVKIFLRCSRDFILSKLSKESGSTEVPTDRERFWWRWPTPEYLDSLVWPKYEKYYGKLFQNRNVEDFPDEQYCRHYDIHMQPELDAPFQETSKWAVEVIIETLSRKPRIRRRANHSKDDKMKRLLFTARDALEIVRRTIDRYILPADD